MSCQTKRNEDVFWSMTCMGSLWWLHAPVWAPIAFITVSAVLWAASAYADHMERKMDRKYPGWRQL